MQTLYGIKVTDRVIVTEEPSPYGKGTLYRPYFDDERCGQGAFTSGRDAVNAAIDFIKRKGAEREAEVQAENERAERKQREADETVLDLFARELSIDRKMLDSFIDVVKRRLQED